MKNFTEILYNSKAPKTANEFYVTGLNQIIEGNEQQAIDSFIQCVKIDTNIIDAYYRLAMLYVSTNEYKKAIRILNDLLLRPSIPKELSKKVEDTLIEALGDAGELHEAIQLIQKKAKECPKDPRYKILLSGIYEDQGNWDEALVAYKAYAKLAKVSDSFRDARIKIGLCRDNYITHPPSIIKQVRSILKSEPHCPSGYKLLLEIYNREGNKRGVIDSWKQYLWHCPVEASKEFKELESQLFSMDSYDAVESILQHAAENRGTHSYAVILLLINFYTKKGETELVEPLFNQLLEVSEVDFVHLKTIIGILDDHGLAEKCISAVRERFRE
ncbi:MAG: tetratricopeptide repeat protein [Fibrobacterales bacterium]